MDRVIFLLVLSTLPQLAVVQDVSVASLRAVVEIVSGSSRVFTGESVRLRCDVPSPFHTVWTYLWSKGSEQLQHTGQNLTLWGARVQDSGKFYCRGLRDTKVGDLVTLQSLPVEINVDGGWAILEVPPRPCLVGDTSKVTCRVRSRPGLYQVILYKDGVEVTRQYGPDPNLYLTLNLEGRGMYSCRASWNHKRRMYSVISANTPLQVVEVLSQPILEIVEGDGLIPAKKMRLICHVQYHAPSAPATPPPVVYYFYKNDNRLGTATREDRVLVTSSPGNYSCKATVAALYLARWSQHRGFKQQTGTEK